MSFLLPASGIAQLDRRAAWCRRALALCCSGLLSLTTLLPAQEPDPFGNPPADGAATADPFGEAVTDEAGEAPDFVIGPESGIGGPEEPGVVSESLWKSEPRGIYVQATSTGLQSLTQLEGLARDVVAGTFTRIYPEVRTASGSAYESRFEATLPVVSSANRNPVGDLAARLKGKAETHAVVTTLPAYNAILGSRPPANNPAGRYPFFVNRTIDGDTVASDNMIHLDPGNPQVREYLAQVLVEIDGTVRPDGILLRGVSYPGRRWGYSEEAVLAFRREVGGEGDPQPDDPIWSAWRREQLTRLVRHLRNALKRVNPDAAFGILVEIDGTAPRNWDEWLRSPAYSERMMDWVGWCKEGLVDEIVLQIHEETRPEGMVLKGWVGFLNSNSHSARPLISLSGSTNFTQGLTLQYNTVRSRGIGTILDHYAAPTRDRSPGFYASFQNVFFRGRAGRPLRKPPVDGPAENRNFTPMDNPPPRVIPPTRTPRPDVNPLAGQDLVFASPTPPPTQTPIPFVVPAQVMRIIKLRGGAEMEAMVLKVTATSITLQEKNGRPMELSRSIIASIEPPL